ncbi:MAG: hypothetical protein AB1894_00675 [Chloroflexota bacterium]
MTENKERKIVTPKGGMLNDLAVRIKLILRLMADARVNPLIKLLPIGSAVYLLFPDLAPGPVDDVAILWLGTYLFVELCPPDVVQEHLEALRQVVPAEWHDATVEPSKTEGQIVDAEYWENNDETG